MRPWELAKAAMVACVLTFLAMSSHADELKLGDHVLALTVGQQGRTYLLHLPPVYDGKRSLPLVIVLHGGGGNAPGAVRMTGFSEKADKEGFVVVYPNGSGRLKTRLLTWNSGNCCGYAMDKNVDDVGFIRALVDELVKTRSIRSQARLCHGHVQRRHDDLSAGVRIVRQDRRHRARGRSVERGELSTRRSRFSDNLPRHG